MTKVSIVIPVYNAGKYIEKCVDSCLRQTEPDIEIVCIDDGSCDNSLEILHHIAVKDDRVRVIHKDNEGVVRARADGVSAAVADFILFVDADDWLSNDAVSSLLVAVDEKTDIVVANHTLVKGGEETYRRVPFSSADMTGLQYLNECMRIHHGYIWGKIYRKSLLKGWNINSNYKLNEDYLINVKCALHARQVKYIDKSVYNYFWDMTIDRVKCPPIDSVMSVLNVHRDVLDILGHDERLRFILLDGYVTYLAHNCANCCSSQIFVSAYSFYKCEWRRAFVRTPCRALCKASEYVPRLPELIMLLFSVRGARLMHRLVDVIIQLKNSMTRKRYELKQ